MGFDDKRDSNTLRRDPANAFRSVGDDGGLVVVPGKQTVQVLNPVGSRIFELLDGKHTRDQIVKIVVDEFEVSEQEAREDLERFLKELEAQELLAGPPQGAGTGS